MIGREDEVRQYRERVKYFHVIVILALSLIAARLFYLQVLKGDELRKFSEANRLKKERLFSTRGIIYDRNGKVIVDNRAAFDVVLLTQSYPFSTEENIRLAKAIGMEPVELQRKMTRASRIPGYQAFLVKADVGKDVLAAIEMDAEGFPWVDIEATVQRRYPYGEIASQLLGYIGEVDPKDIKNDSKKELLAGDYIGKMGIERQYDKFLRGSNGVGYVEVDAMGRRRKTEGNERLFGFVSQTEPTPGHNLFLTIDADLQEVAAKAMGDRKFHGSVIALDPRNGEILALVNSPSYEPGLISGREVNSRVWAELANNKERPLRNRAIMDHYPPGSTFKLILAIAGLAEGVVSTKSSVNCSGSMPFGSRSFNCWKRHGHVEFTRAIKESCDVFFYNLGLQLGVDTISKYARLFGFGEQTGILLAGEQKGLIPDSEWKQRVYKDIWHAGETLSVAIGQGYVDATPIQLVTAYAAIGNQGFVYRPMIVKKIQSRSGEVIAEYRPDLLRKIEVPDEVFHAVKEGLFQVVNEPGGTAFLSKSKLTTLAGKTGTAQVRAFADIRKAKCEEMDYDHRHHGWFVGFAPRDNPQIAVAAIAEHGCHGSSAGPVVREVVDAFMRKQAEALGKPIDASLIGQSGESPPAVDRRQASEPTDEGDTLPDTPVLRKSPEGDE